MAGLDDVLERLVAHPSFRQRLAANPSAALAGYDLSDEDRALLASQVTDDAGAGGKVEARTSRASMAGLLGVLEELADASAELGTVGEPDASPAAGDDSDKWMNLDSFNVGGNQTGDGVGHDVLLGGEGVDDPIPTAPSGSGYNELSLQDTSGREPSGPANLADDLASDDIVPPPEAPTPIFGEILVSPMQVGGSDAMTDEDGGIADVVVAPADGESGPNPRAAVEAVADADRHEARADRADALVWDPGDGSDVAEKGEHIEIESWSPGTPTSSAEPDLLDEQVGFAYEAIKFRDDALPVGDLVEPDASDPEPTGPIADVLYSAGGSPTDDVSGADAAITDRAEPDSAEPAGAGPNADLDAPTTADPLMATFAEYSVNLYQGEVGDTPGAADLEMTELAGSTDQTDDAAQASPWNEGYHDFNVKGAEPDPGDTPPSDSPGWVYPILPQMDQSSAVVGGGSDAPHDLGETHMTDDGGAGASGALGSPDTEPVEAGGTEADLYAYPGEYAQRFHGVDESAPGAGLDVLIAGHTVHESEDTVPEDQAEAIGGDADRAARQGGGITNDSGTMTLAGSTLTQPDDTVPENQTIAVGAGDPEPAGATEPTEVLSYSWGVSQVPTFVEDGDEAARSLADPAPAATDGWVNVGRTEQYLFDNTDIAEPEFEDVAPPESRDPEPTEAVVGDLNAFEFSDGASAAPSVADAPMVETRTVDADRRLDA